MHEAMLVLFSWALWCFVHSLLIARWWTRWMQRWLGSRYAWYRMFYTVFSVLSLLPVLLVERSVHGTLLLAWTFPLSLVQWAVLGAALALLLGGARQYDQRYFFGLAQIDDFKRGKKPESPVFKAGGVLRRVRHPYYTAGILFVLFWGDVTSVSIVSKTVLILYFVIGAILEERKLLAEFGDAYAEYQRQVPMLLPGRGRRE
jgi:protein-S-isoprenylcysteine O-methyltransferase Ste14